MTQPHNQSDTQLIQFLKSGDKKAANELIDRYFHRVVAAAEKQLLGRRIPVSDGNDIAVSVFDNLWKRANENRLYGDELRDSQQLWKLLCVMVANKAKDHLRRDSAQKRGGGILKGESWFSDPENGVDIGIDDLNGKQLPIADLVILKEQHDHLLDILDDEILRQVCIMRLEGYKVAEIAAAYEKTERWVGRKLNLIRAIWQQEFDSMTSR